MEQTCTYPNEYIYNPQNDSVMPVSSLWSASTEYYTIDMPSGPPRNEFAKNDIIISGIFLAFFVLLIISSKEILNVYPAVIKSFFKLKNHIKLEERLAISNQRDIVAGVVLLYYPILITLTFDDLIIKKYNIIPELYLVIIFVALTCLWLVRKGLFNLLSWLMREKNAFRFIEKISYNYLISSVIITFPAAMTGFFWPGISDDTIVKTLLYCSLFVYFIYLTKTWQIIISRRFSLFFYILYLCTLEFLPIALIVNLILSI
ncbi:MAG: DUF4271 domain-containing protein [Bacteroidales bacterium]|nr:DUF4271 domain-containing protein [Bacteroidales bacterium]